MTIVGLHGHARSGKDTVADYLVENHGYTRVALADAVRDAVYALNPWTIWVTAPTGFAPVQDIVNEHGWDKLKATEEGRRLLQVMGTEVGRQMFGDNVWLDIAARKVDAVSGPVVVTDIRFENELLWLKQWFSSRSVKIARPGYGPVNAHSSDAGLQTLLFDARINNDGTLEELYTKVETHVIAHG